MPLCAICKYRRRCKKKQKDKETCDRFQTTEDKPLIGTVISLEGYSSDEKERGWKKLVLKEGVLTPFPGSKLSITGKQIRNYMCGKELRRMERELTFEDKVWLAQSLMMDIFAELRKER